MTFVFRTFMRCRKGSFAVATALILTILLMCVGLVLDAGSAYQTRDRLQDAVDAAALAASAAMIESGSTPEKARAAALSMLQGQLNASGELAYLISPIVKITQSDATQGTKIFAVDVTASFELPPGPFRDFFAAQNTVFSLSGRSTSTIQPNDPISLFFVLDRSGSMNFATTIVDPNRSACNNFYAPTYPQPTFETPCYIAKIGALKAAVGTVLDQVDVSDPSKAYIRVGAVSYHWFADQPQWMDWGTRATRAYISALKAEGSTNSRYAMNVAYDVLTAPSENQAHFDKNGGKPRKYLIFMSDGANDYESSDGKTLVWCNAIKRAGIQIFTVAYMAPQRGVDLLAACASGPEFRYNVETTEEFFKAFQTLGETITRLTNRLSQ